MSGHFRVKSKLNLDRVELGQQIPESDFCTLTPEGNFVQLEYIEEPEKKQEFPVKPGIWSIIETMTGMSLERTELNSDKILETFVHTKHITDKIDCFFNKLAVYKRFGIEVPKRALLLYGPAGSGKSTLIAKTCRHYAALNDTAVILWKTDKQDPYQVKELFKHVKYEGVSRLILVAEDLGGIEAPVGIKSESSLLALLDNQEKAFSIPTMILLTTNFPDSFLGNLMDRPQRIDDKIEVGYPSGEARGDLFRFFATESETPIEESALELVKSKKCQAFTPAHVKEVFIRSAIYDKTIPVVIDEILREIQAYKAAFTKRTSLGISSVSSDLD